MFGELIDVLTDYTANGSFASLAKNVTVYDDINFAKWIRIQNLDNMDYENNIKYVDENSYNFLKKSKLKGNELLISKTGEYLGKVYIFDNSKERCTLADNIFLIRLKNKQLQNYIYAYINSKLGRNEILRWNQGTGQPTIIKESLRNIKIPLLSENLIDLINNLVEEGFNKYSQSKEIYEKTQRLFEEKINIIQEQEIINYNIKKKSNTIDIYNRMDAEYYQQEYDNFRNSIMKYNGKKRTIGEICNIFDKNYIPEDNRKYRYIELANINNNSEILNVEEQLGSELPTRARRLVKKGQVIVSSIEGSLNSCAIIDDEFDGAICSNGFFVINSDYINSECLLVTLKSKIMQSLLKQQCTGTILTGINKDDFKRVEIPVLDEESQNNISLKIQEAFKMRKRAKQCLEIAQNAIKIAIEENEEVATKYLKNIAKEG